MADIADDLIAAAQQRVASGATSTGPAVQQVYLGYQVPGMPRNIQPNVYTPPRAPAASGSPASFRQAEEASKKGPAAPPPNYPSTRQEGVVTDTDQANLLFYTWSDEDRDAWGDYLVGLGLITQDEAGDWKTLQKFWTTYVGDAANFASAGKRVSPWDVARMDSKAPGNKAAAGGAGGPAKVRDTTSKSVNLTDPTTARAVVNQALSQYLGRDANDEEAKAFTAALNAQETANPNVTKTHYNADGTSSSSVTTGGTNAGELARESAMADPNYAEYQAASTVYNAFISALGTPVGP